MSDSYQKYTVPTIKKVLTEFINLPTWLKHFNLPVDVIIFRKDTHCNTFPTEMKKEGGRGGGGQSIDRLQSVQINHLKNSFFFLFYGA
jgi:hypothetical protein